MAEVISLATAMSASQRAKKVSMTEDEPALAAWITEVVETLSRSASNVKLVSIKVLSHCSIDGNPGSQNIM